MEELSVACNAPTFFKLNNLRMAVARLGPRRRGLASSVMPGSSAAPFFTTTEEEGGGGYATERLRGK
jgi:hypothetical protein